MQSMNGVSGQPIDAMDTLGLLHGLRFIDSFFPSGGYAFSSGLEAAVQQGAVRDAEDFREYVEEMLRARGLGLEGRRCVVSGSGNVAIFAIEKLEQLGAKVVACSDSDGYVVHEAGIDLALVKRIKLVDRRRIETYVEHHRDARFIKGGSIWDVPCAVALLS